jgi:RNA polymerase sigma-70 factor (ECF subfamily)
MGPLHFVHSARPVSPPETSCIAAFERELDYVFETLRRLGANPGDVEDLAHEIFLVLHTRWATFDQTRPIRPYLFGVAFRIVRAHGRRRAREKPHAVVDMKDGAVGPEGSLQLKESAKLLMAALERVPIQRRAIIILHDLDEVPVADIAQSLSISRFGAYARLRKGRRELAAAVRRLLNER